LKNFPSLSGRLSHKCTRDRVLQLLSRPSVTGTVLLRWRAADATSHRALRSIWRRRGRCL
jgi:hypothetical protein